MRCSKCGADIRQEDAKALDGTHAVVWSSKQDWICPVDLNEHSPGEPSWWVLLERDRHDDMAIGPYATEEAAAYAAQNALLVDGYCEEDCLEVYVTDRPEHDDDFCIIDPRNPQHVGYRHVGRLLSGTIDCSCGWSTAQHALANDALIEFDKHRDRWEPVPQDDPRGHQARDE